MRRFSSAWGHGRMGLRAAHMLTGCHIIGYTEAAHAEEPEQATALLWIGLGGRPHGALLLKLVTGRDAMSSFVSGHNHSPNAYIASPLTTVV